MEKFTKLTGVAAPLPMRNVDTDMIIPKQFLKTIKRTGLGKSLFFEMRFDEAGKEIPDFVLNQPAYRGATILVTGENFGCGSSREHAPWALLDFGIRCIIAPDFADIFYNNCFQNGILPIKLPQADVDKLMDDASRGANATVTVDLESAGDPRPRRRRDQVRHRSVPQALPLERPRQHRADAGEAESDRGLRGKDADRAALALEPAHAKLRNGEEEMAKPIHMMVRVADEARSVDFYSKAFGLKVADRVDFPDFTLIYMRESAKRLRGRAHGQQGPRRALQARRRLRTSRLRHRRSRI